MSPRPHILVVDDDLEIRKLLGRYLNEQGFKVSVASTRLEFEKLSKDVFDIIVLDVLLPDGSGLDICRIMRDRRPRVPVILLTALKEDVDKIIGLEIGADDYLGKPFNPRELVARIRAVMRRGEHSNTMDSVVHTFRFGEFIVDSASRRVVRNDGKEISMTGAEFELLIVFLLRPGRVLSRDQLLDLTRSRASEPFDRSIDVLVSRLRRKLGDEGSFAIIKTVRNGGYQMVMSVTEVKST
jgi:two-component system, OmpR family, response regulator